MKRETVCIDFVIDHDDIPTEAMSLVRQILRDAIGNGPHLTVEYYAEDGTDDSPRSIMRRAQFKFRADSQIGLAVLGKK